MQCICATVDPTGVTVNLLAAQASLNVDALDLETPDGESVATVRLPDNYRGHMFDLWDSNYRLERV